MNERIKQLYEQSLTHTTGKDHAGNPMAIIKQNPEKFAELIVRECRDIVSTTRDQAIEDGWNVDEAMSTAMFDIEDHFGV